MNAQKTHLMLTAGALAFALVVAGCGGGGSSSTSVAPPSGGGGTPPMDMEEMGPTEAEQIAALTLQINNLRTQLGLPADGDVGESIGELQKQVDDLEEQVAAAQKDAEDAARKDMTAKGKAIFGVLDTFGAAGVAVGDAPTAEIAATPPAVSASYGKATTVTAASLATFANGRAAIDSDPEFTSGQTDAPETLPANNGFSGTMRTWSNTSKADTMVVYTDIAAQSRALFSERYGGGEQSITSATNGGLDGDQTGVTGAAFDGRTGGLVEHDANAKSATTEPENDVVKLPGAYKMAMGSYTCTPAAITPCTSTVNSDGSITFSADNWTFTANTGEMVSVADSAYMLFGWWMRDVEGTARILDHVAVFHGSQGGTAVGDVAALTGKASYEGGAAGKYAWRDRVEDTAHGGHFTAKAALSADFDTNMMSGSISDFQLGDYGTDPNWTVTLRQTGITIPGSSVVRAGPDGTAGNADDATTQWAVGESKADAAGGWEAQFSSTGKSRNDDLPTGVSGAFNAEFGEQGRMLGAFGANITNPNPPN